MALTVDQNWWIRVSGDDTNGGGYDSTVSGAGTNYANQDAAQLTITDGATTGAVATLTSAAAGFTSQMVGNVIRISAGTNFTVGYYCIITFTNTSTVILDRACATGVGTGGTGNVGGAFASPRPLCTTCAAGAPAITSPLAAAHVVNVEGSGTQTPSVATYTWSTGYTFPDGAPTGNPGGVIKWLSTSGKVRIDSAGTFAVYAGHLLKDFYWVCTSRSGGSYMVNIRTDGSGLACWLYDCVFDQNGYGIGGTTFTNVVGCGFINSGTGGNTQASATAAVAGIGGEPNGTTYGRVMGNSFIGWIVDDAGGGQGTGVVSHPNWLTIEGNLFANCVCGYGVDTATTAGNSSVYGNTFYNMAGGVLFIHFQIETSYFVRNNLFVSISGIAMKNDTSDVGDGHVPARYNLHPDYNAFYNCGTKYSGWTSPDVLGDHDVTLTADPFVNAAGLNFQLNTTAGGGAAVDGLAFPTAFYGTNT